jgi:hypothetical protein
MDKQRNHLPETSHASIRRPKLEEDLTVSGPTLLYLRNQQTDNHNPFCQGYSEQDLPD